MVTGQPAQFTYSATYVEDYPGNRSLYPYGNNALETVNYYLNRTEGWTLVFAKGNSEVTREDLGTQGGGLNNAVFHYHFSHGGRLLPEGNTVLELSNDNYVYPQEVRSMWGRNNKWTYIDSCIILDDLSWGEALNTSHGIFGYKSEIGSKHTIWTIRDFFDNAIYLNKTLLLSYENASCYGVQYSDFKNVTSAAIFRNEQQARGDHLPGHGTIEPDAEPSDIPQRINWSC